MNVLAPTGSAFSILVLLLIIASWVPGSAAVLASAVAGNEPMPPRAREAAGSWTPAGTFVDGRHEHTATLLSDGRVLIVGGLQQRTPGSPGLASAEVYDPASGTWDVTGSLERGRALHTATLLSDGTVLVTGGTAGYSGPALDSVEIYDPGSGTWSAAPPLSAPRYAHSATRLADGRVLVAGGRASAQAGDVLASAELYDPTSRTWSPVSSLLTPREGHSGTLLPDGQVLVVNGYYQDWLASAEVYDPASGTWHEIAGPPACHGVAHTATLMANGQVLVAGGACGSGTPGILDAADVYDPATFTWSATTALPAAREAHTATLLPEGTVLVAGGDNGDAPRYDSALLYDPASGIWTPTGSLAIGRRNHTATLLDDGTVLVAGGWSDISTSLEGAERYQGAVNDTTAPAGTPLPATNTPTVVPTNTPLPTIVAPTEAPTNTPPPPTDAFFLGGNPSIVLLSAAGTVICAGVTVGLVAMIAGIVLYFRSGRRR